MSKAPGSTTTNGPPITKSYFEQQRSLLVNDIGESLERVLQNINKLNRSLEGVIAVGNEFSAVEALWSHFENVMAKEPEPEPGQDDGDKTVVGTETLNTPSQTEATTRR